MSRASILRMASLLVFAILMIGTAPAQTDSKPDAKPKSKAKTKGKPAASTTVATKSEEDESAPPTLFGDPKKFTRLGGWGSFGNAMGQFGFAKSTLIMMPAVQSELKLTDTQKKQLQEWSDIMRKRGETWGRSFRQQNGNDPFRGGDDLPIAARVLQFTNIINQFSSMAQENENGFNRILDKSQRVRLNQISLQMEGVSALTRPDVIKALNIDEVRQEEIQSILTQTRMSQMTTWVGSMMSMRSGRRPPTQANAEKPPAADAPAPEPKAETPKAAPDPKARAERERALRKQFQSMRDQTDQLQDRAVREISRLLTKNQRVKFEKLLGPPFDPAKINTLGPPPRRDQPEASDETIKQ